MSNLLLSTIFSYSRATMLPKILGATGTIVKYLAFVHMTSEYLLNIIITSGPSMEPTIQENDVIITEVISARRGNFNKNDIIIARSPLSPKHLICKRIVGEPGEAKNLEDDSVVIVPRGSLWIEGDNENNSNDSRSYGPVPKGLVKGRAIMRIWPPHRITIFNNSS